jgi:hypothetical protein
MIIDKFFNYKINAFTVSSQIIKMFRMRKSIGIDELFNEIGNLNIEISQDIILEALGLLYLTGKIDYNFDTDNMEIKK